MHPAKSVILFTTASGAGYGMMIWLAVLAALGMLPQETVFGILVFGLAFALIVGGLLSSTFHLGRPERAWRAMSQWRSSWLSREGLAAIIGFVPLGLFALVAIFGIADMALGAVVGVIGAAMALLTLYFTSMIYASLRTIPAWHNGWTVAGYLVLGPMNGAVFLAFLFALFGFADAAAAMRSIALAMLLAGLAVKLLYWQNIRTSAPVSTAGTATGLGHLGKVEMTGSPHDSDNYLLREMGFRIARKHAEKLRRIATLLGFVVPIICVALGLVFAEGPLNLLVTLLSVIACQIGITAERWLFFAEAKHAVTLYYGEQAV
ncbi:dimethyl sulfoxide reductase anchor subunit family protein [Qipengyuania sphaerica]|uniref:dimethyl sulfoxide reductase anchor subunit family protein n=1 Tax=Qipengyuania sphaerica TaxID=2867243 RepID=UPI001C882A96|nr:DmsC/YnfH family molybdoenzyme membrane anchor subunit [Qipengyuania sphaerica]MBX7539681.1 dimethyl sulfoxide reductase anchor subunit [Qipengyuania sphaerica]